MLTRLISTLKARLRMTKTQRIGRANVSEGDSFATLPNPWPIAQVEEEEDPRAV